MVAMRVIRVMVGFISTIGDAIVSGLDLIASQGLLMEAIKEFQV
jgi:hypothetical protein